MIFKSPEEKKTKYMNSRAYDPNSYAVMMAGRAERVARIVRAIKLSFFALFVSAFIGLMLYLSVSISKAGTIYINDDSLSYVCKHYGVYDATKVSGGEIYVECHHWVSMEPYEVHVPSK